MLLASARKSAKTEKLVGCAPRELVRHLEMQFTPGMTWENYGAKGWHIDHIKPCSMFNMQDPKHQKMCFHYKNLRPMWGRENQSKGAKLVLHSA